MPTRNDSHKIFYMYKVTFSFSTSLWNLYFVPSTQPWRIKISPPSVKFKNDFGEGKNAIHNIVKILTYRHGVKVRPGPREPRPWDPRTRDPRSPSKFKSGTLIIIFPHCLTYFIQDKYIYLIRKQISTNIRYFKLYSLFWTHPPFSWNL